MFGGTMYEAFYGLKEKPFNLTPDPRFLYLSEKHREAFAHLLFGIKNRSGFVMVTGEIGTGKTTICRSLLSQLGDDIEVAFIFNPFLSPEELLRKINEDFGIRSRAITVKGLIDELNAYLLDRNAKGKNCVLVIDEAQNLKPPVLEQVRLLSNLETETQKLLQIVLIGQPELGSQLELPELRQLNQRIVARYHLKPLDEKETLQYIAYRLRVAGGRRKVQFQRRAIRRVYRASKGTPRVINAVCDRALLIGYTRETHEITAPIVRQAVREIRGERMRPRREFSLGRYVPSPRLLAAAALIVLAGRFVVAPLVQTLRRPGGLGMATSEASAPNAHEAAPPVTPAANPAPTPDPVPADPPVEPPRTPAPPADSLGDALLRVDPASTRQTAALDILRRWNMAPLGGYPEDDSVRALGRFLEAHGLSHEAIFPTIEGLETLNLPAFIKLRAGGKTLWAGLVGFEEGRALCAVEPGETLAVDREELRSYYLNQAVVPWRDPAPGAPVLRADMRGDAVRDLQAQLRRLGRWEGDPTGLYDEHTADAVARIQAETGLSTDGKAGKQVRMVLCSWLPDAPTPFLRAEAPPTHGAETPAPTPEPPPDAPESPETAAAAPETETDPTEPTTPDAEPLEPAAPDTPVEPAAEDTLPDAPVQDPPPAVTETAPPPQVPEQSAFYPDAAAAADPLRLFAPPTVHMSELGPPDSGLGGVSTTDIESLVFSDGNPAAAGKRVTEPAFTGMPLAPHRAGASDPEGSGTR